MTYHAVQHNIMKYTLAGYTSTGAEVRASGSPSSWTSIGACVVVLYDCMSCVCIYIYIHTHVILSYTMI